VLEQQHTVTDRIRKRRICVYCGASGKMTPDHIPPKGIFARPRPSNLITVPACKDCNAGASEDDEYFKMCLGLNDQARGHPDIKSQTDSIFRALYRPEARGISTKLVRETFRVDSISPSGLYLGKRYAFNVDLPRIFRVVERIVRGLYFHETGERLPHSHGVAVWSEETLVACGHDAIEHARNTIVAPLLQVQPKTVGPATFSYRHLILPDLASAWLLGFYDRIFFLAVTTRDQDGTATESLS